MPKNSVKIVRKGNGFAVEWLSYHGSFAITKAEAAKFAEKVRELLKEYAQAEKEGSDAYVIDGLSDGRLHLYIRGEDEDGKPVRMDEGPAFLLGIAQCFTACAGTA